jgi:hypothetical protein
MAGPEKDRSEEDIRREVARRLDEIEDFREYVKRRGLAFAALIEEELGRKIQGVTARSPYIYTEDWMSGTVRGRMAYYLIPLQHPIRSPTTRCS